MVDNPYGYEGMPNATSDDKETWNTGAGYYFRLDQLLTEATKARYNGDKNRWYISLIAIFIEIYPKYDKNGKIELKKSYDKIVKEYNDKEHNANAIEDHSLMTFEITLREALEEKGMLTPHKSQPGELA